MTDEGRTADAVLRLEARRGQVTAEAAEDALSPTPGPFLPSRKATAVIAHWQVAGARAELGGAGLAKEKAPASHAPADALLVAGEAHRQCSAGAGCPRPIYRG